MPLHRLYDTKEEAKEHIAGPSEPGVQFHPPSKFWQEYKQNLVLQSYQFNPSEFSDFPTTPHIGAARTKAIFVGGGF